MIINCIRVKIIIIKKKRPWMFVQSQKRVRLGRENVFKTSREKKEKRGNLLARPHNTPFPVTARQTDGFAAKRGRDVHVVSRRAARGPSPAGTTTWFRKPRRRTPWTWAGETVSASYPTSARVVIAVGNGGGWGGGGSIRDAGNGRLLHGIQ